MNPAERACARKKRYPTALGAIRAALNSSMSFGKPMRHYRCEGCKGWHVTSRAQVITSASAARR